MREDSRLTKRVLCSDEARSVLYRKKRLSFSSTSLRTNANARIVVVVRGQEVERWRAVLASLRMGTMDKSRSSLGIICAVQLSIVAYSSQLQRIYSA